MIARECKLVKRFQCLHTACTSSATDQQLKAVLSADELSLCERKKFTENLGSLKGIVECPVGTCGACYFFDEQQKLNCSSHTPNFAECTYCKYVFCMECRNAYHGTQPCEIDSEQRRKLLTKYGNVESVDKNGVLATFGGERNLAKYIAKLKCDEWIDGNCKQCPTCHVNVHLCYYLSNILLDGAICTSVQFTIEQNSGQDVGDILFHTIFLGLRDAEICVVRCVTPSSAGFAARRNVTIQNFVGGFVAIVCDYLDEDYECDEELQADDDDRREGCEEVPWPSYRPLDI
ncbi:unnamed protein product [Anisakis simplex]|uniref:RBR-type E3 ubiquitin transferase n=1 Tax=Anisakis simplex TaxID=6269 RepID=A0A0M3K7E8_ANISI|nr:unnamed protein product [Anisakis simplex]